MMPRLIWKEILGFESLYIVSNYGHVISLRSLRLLKPDIICNRYLRFRIYKDKVYRKTAHRLVAENFLTPSDCFYIVNHKDSNELNNYVGNLEWTDYQGNINHYLQGKKRGVYWNKKNKKWKADIGFNGDRVFIGLFNDKEKAYKAYKKAYKQLHGHLPW